MAFQFQLPAEILHGNVEDILAQGIAVIDAMPSGDVLSIECYLLETFDSSALSALLSMRRRAQEKNIHIQLSAIPQKLASLAKVYGVADVVLV